MSSHELMGLHGNFRYSSSSFSGSTAAGPGQWRVLRPAQPWVVVVSLAVCFGTWYLIERTRLGVYLRAGTENAALVQAFGINVPLMVMLTYGAGGSGRGAGSTHHPDQSADGIQPDHRGLCGGSDRGHGLHHGLHRDRSNDSTCRSVWQRGLSHIQSVLLVCLTFAALLAPMLGLYSIFLMKLLCFALFACALNPTTLP